MSQDVTQLVLPPGDHAALKVAVKALESPNLAAKIADYAGIPVNRVLNLLPKAANRQLSGLVRSAVLTGLEVAVDTLNEKPPPSPAVGFSSFLAGVTGGVSGLFGFGALTVELPLTTTLMLRAIAEIAQHEGEDLSKLEARLACLEVFAYGTKKTSEGVDVGYYAARALISKYTSDAAAYILERGAVDASAPVISNLVSEIVSRFGLVVSDKVAAGAVPIIGAVFGATVNVIFMDHFQKMAKGHFTLRRLERVHGSATVRHHYAEIANDLAVPRGVATASTAR
ncbi:EcsC family protein [Bradyrhizobium sp. LTSPM299]|uniref:EcsC family protein n=1 Tax=Bradyrhizobium sp. LTSPM299 TaxID=1619233 RepID=UPI0005C88BA8|nr:EcsC family protein [Bradyrhizobium sp. LTSPM299]